MIENTTLANSTYSPLCIKKSNKVHNDRVYKIILNYQKGVNCSKIAKYEDFPRNIVSSILKKFNEADSFIQPPKGGKKHPEIIKKA